MNTSHAGLVTLWHEFFYIVKDLRDTDMDSGTAEGLKLLKMNVDEFVRGRDFNTYQQDIHAVNTNEMVEQFRKIYKNYQHNTRYFGLASFTYSSENENVKFVQEWYKLFKKHRTDFYDKQQRYAIYMNEPSDTKKALFDSQFSERMRAILGEKIAVIDRQIMNKFDENLKSCAEKSKLNCTITSINLKGKLRDCSFYLLLYFY